MAQEHKRQARPHTCPECGTPVQEHRVTTILECEHCLARREE
ncbi:hypothetical protein [Thalassobacillus sp. CUG 92003]|nr:hypothetical protein [Thalassobacillus sp. CUG 92003]